MPSFKGFLGKSGGTAALVLILSLSLGLNVYLAVKGPFHRTVPLPTLKANEQLPAQLPITDADGKPVSFTFADDPRPTVLYVLSPLCGWCKRNEANMKALVAETGSKYRYIGLSIESKNLKEYIAAGRSPFPVYLLSAKDVMKKLEFTGTPETIVVSPDARVQASWEGAYTDKNQTQVEKFFGIKLPGLPQVASAAHQQN